MTSDFIATYPDLVKALFWLVFAGMLGLAGLAWRTSVGAIKELAGAFKQFTEAFERRMDKVEREQARQGARCEERHKK